MVPSVGEDSTHLETQWSAVFRGAVIVCVARRASNPSELFMEVGASAKVIMVRLAASAVAATQPAWLCRLGDNAAGPPLTSATKHFGSLEVLVSQDLVDQMEPFHELLVRARPLRERLTGINAINNIHGLLLSYRSRF
jgi:hypothetical protein